MGVNYAHTEFVRFANRHIADQEMALNDHDHVELQKVLDNMQVTAKHAMSVNSRANATKIYDELQVLMQPPLANAAPVDLAAIDADITKMVQNYSSEGLAYRMHSDDILEGSKHRHLIALALALMVTSEVIGLLI